MDLKRMVRNRQFWLAVVLAAAGIFMGASYPKPDKDSVLTSGTFLKLAADSLKSRTVLFLLPIVSVLPCGEEYLRERQWNFLRFLIIRRGRREYCLDKMMTTAFSGVLVWVVAGFLTVLFFFLFFFGKEEVWSCPLQTIQEFFIAFGRIGLVGSFIASLGAVCAVIGRSVYLAMGLPFVLYYILMILRERYLETFYCMDPSEWVKGECYWGTGQSGLWIFLLLLAAVFMALHGIVLAKSLDEI